MFKDQNGNLSSKRILGTIGVLFAMGLSVVALRAGANGSAVDLVKAWLLFSGGLLGISVAEFFKG